MVNPIYIFIIALFIAFLLPLIDKVGRKFAFTTFFLSLGVMSLISLVNMFNLSNGASPFEIYTAGFRTPFSINLRMGLYEAFVLTTVNMMAVLSAIYMMKRFIESKIMFLILYLMFIMGINGLVMTRDIFNLFVFMEITSISIYGLLGSRRNSRSISSGFKYLIAGGLASSFFLIGITYVYRFSGSLSLDLIINESGSFAGITGMTAIFFVLMSILIELKVFPANGWALDVYESSLPGIAANISVVASTGMLFALYKIMPLIQPNHLIIITGIGLLTFFMSNLMGLKQQNVKRMLGYSSVAQIGLMISGLAYMTQYGFSGFKMTVILGGLFINHFLAKAGLFWLTGIVKKKHYRNWGIIAGIPCYIMALGVFVVALTGLPPFPGFYAKWTLLSLMGGTGNYLMITTILAGSLFEAGYLFRWFGHAVKNGDPDEIKPQYNINRFAPVLLFALLLFISGLFVGYYFDYISFVQYAPLLAAMLFYLIKKLSLKFKGIIALIIIVLHAWFVVPQVEGILHVFSAVFLFGGFVLTIATMYRKSKRSGYFIALLLMVLSLNNLLISKTTIEFFLFWELMTIGSYMLVLRGKESRDVSLLYIIWSLAGSFLVLGGFAVLSGGHIEIPFYDFSIFASSAVFNWGYVLLCLGFLVKTGAVGLHVWLPGTYAKAEDDSSAFISAILSKAGILGLVMLVLIMGTAKVGKINILTMIGWVGVITAVLGAMQAVYQEDVKKMMAYSSMSQLGYIVLALAVYNHSGLVTGLYLTVNHFLVKSLIFLSIAGVIYRTKTRYMYEMGGLVKKMPATFISALMAIIAMSGVPPLTGFGGKWLIYTTLIEEGWYLQAGLAFFASSIAFLYLFRFIHTIFLGQLKTRHRTVREAPIWLLIPQYIVIFVVMAFSTLPNLLLKPLHRLSSYYFEPSLKFEGHSVISSMGYWNGTAIMIVTMVIFAVLLAWLLLIQHRSKKIGQLNIVYAAERPDRPETTHFAHNFFAHYRKALGFFAEPYATRFWNTFSDGVHTIGNVFRHIYTGNAQTYAIHIILFTGIVYLIFRGI